MNNTWAAPGVRWVCIKEEWDKISIDGYPFNLRIPILNEILTIKAVLPAQGIKHNGVIVHQANPVRVFLQFWEIPTEQSNGPIKGTDLSWVADHFRPLIQKKTDISMLIALTNNVSQELEDIK